MSLNDGPPSNRQIKVLKFFGRLPDKSITKGEASGIITSIFRDNEKRDAWNKYVYLTGDDDQDSQDLKRFDVYELLKTEVPEDWHPPHEITPDKPSKKVPAKKIQERVQDILKEGIPFDDPVPNIEYAGKAFCFTGTFLFGERKDCVDVVKKKGGVFHDNIQLNTDYVIVGGKITPSFAHKHYGQKIEKALKNKLQGQSIFFLSEEEWVKTL